MFRIISFLFILLLAGVVQAAFAQDFDETRYEQFIAETMDASSVPGLAVILFDGDGVFYEKSFGIADKDKTPVSLDTPFQLGSVSKSFAALLLVQLAAENQLDLDAPVSDFLPDFRPQDKIAGREMTVREIIAHRSGFSTLDGNREQDNTDRGSDVFEKAVAKLNTVQLQSEPGSVFQYSNANYMIVAALVETISGKEFETVMDERIFTPLNMTNSYVQKFEGDHLKEATGFRQWFGMPRARAFTSGRVMMAAGGVVASAYDLALYVRAVSSRDSRIIPPEFADALLLPIETNGATDSPYGYGWMFAELEGRDVIYHSGLNGGFSTQVAFFPGTGRGGVVLTNLSGSLQGDVAGAVLRKGLGVPTGAAKPGVMQYVNLWGLVATVISLLMFAVRSIRQIMSRPPKFKKRNWFLTLLPTLLLFGLAYGCLVVFPRLNGIELSGIKTFYPDLWLCLSLSGVFAMIWGVSRLVVHMRYRHLPAHSVETD
ncbi:MAG: beta-lactamase family protein [Hyphomonadaceae bacterium]|nr:beta-lactamase family protein [Hyphomonadaceae bacterium]